MEEAYEIAITLEPEDVEGAEDLKSAGAVYAKFERLFNSFWRVFWRADTTYVCTYQDASEKSWNALEWFYAGSNYAPAHQLW